MHRDWIDPPSLDSHDKAVACLTTDGAHGAGLYAILDPSFAPDAHWRRLPFSGKGISLFAGKYQGAGLDAMAPQFYVMPDEQGERDIWLQGMLAMSAGLPMLSFVSSAMQPPVLLACLQQKQEAAVDDEHFIVRFTDTRCLPAWFDVLSLQQRVMFMKGLETWWYFDRAGEFCSLPFDAPGATPQPGPDDAVCRLSQAQQMALRQAALPDTVIAYLRDRPGIFGALCGTPSQIHTCVTDVLRGAELGGNSVSADTYRHVLAALDRQGLLMAPELESSPEKESV